MSHAMQRGRSPKYPPPVGTGLYAQVVDILGQEIVSGGIPAGSIVYADQLCERLGVSRSVVREGVRTLSSMGLVEARPQVGTRVLPQSRWDLLNPYIVKWRGQGPGYIEQMKELLELRLGIEHAAAGLAATRLNEEGAREILSRAHAMHAAYEVGDARQFFDMDSDFHRLLLEGTQNVVIAQLADTISATLDARSNDTRPGMHNLSVDSVKNHILLAEALVDRDADRAQQMAIELVQLTLVEFETIPPASLR